MGTHKKKLLHVVEKYGVRRRRETYSAFFLLETYFIHKLFFWNWVKLLCFFFLKLVFKGKTALLGLFESKLLLALVYATAFSDVCSMMFVVAPYLEWHTGMFASLSINILTSVTSTPTEFIEIEKKKPLGEPSSFSPSN